MKTKLLLTISLLTLTCTNASALSVQNSFLGEEPTRAPIHATDIHTSGKTISGFVTLAVGKGEGFACNIEHTTSLKFTFSDIGHFYLDGAKLAKEYGLDLTCAIETYVSEYGSLGIDYSLTLDKTQKKYDFATPFKHIIDLVRN